MKTLIFLLILLCSRSVAQRFRLTEHFMSYWGSVGYSNLTPTLSTEHIQSSTGQAAMALGIAYERSIGSQLFFSTGIELNRLSFTLRLHDFSIEKTLFDTDSETYTENLFEISFADYQERNRLLYANLPIFFGWKYRHFYGLAGFKVAFNLSSRYSADTKVTSSRDYQWFVDKFTDMPTHWALSNAAFESKRKTLLSTNVILSAEIGFRQDLSSRRSETKELRLGVFIDYGITEIHSKNMREHVVDEADLPVVNDLTSVLDLEETKTQTTKPLYAGIKLTYSFCFKKQWNCCRHKGTRK